MNKGKRLLTIVDNAAGLIADVIVAVFLIVLTAALLILPPLAVFAHGLSGLWLFLTYIGVPASCYCLYVMARQTSSDIACIKEGIKKWNS